MNPEALLLIDLQNDFLPTGALPVPGGDQVLPIANALMPRFTQVFATQDWHPANHASFAANHPGKKPGDLIDLDGLPQILWTAHCVANSPGADFAPALDRSRISRIVRKGSDPRVDSYSGFFDNGHRHATSLDADLRARNISSLYILGLATDYCVKFTALDARQLGYTVHLVLDGCRGVNLQTGDVDAAIEEMRRAGVLITTSADIPTSPR
ncbi:MAG TPA: bifunctional nicotinamidase/pyrazinamidase [Phycisphaerae bacterium]|nr:bifunctional nicotinamidase/pyrazinamidase [Phycisphaerae bacterium]